ncbi:MAG: hypothetical protein JXR88_13145 [Clostridia bacterium]|nr:hypothetical protein [Clostridia bacterium]
MKEAELYLPIKAFFIENGYEVAGEVKDVDMVVYQEDTKIAIELKTSFNLKLIFQAVERQKYFESVYVAIPKPKFDKRYREMVHLLKRLEIGLITVNFLKTKTVVHVEHHPIVLERKTNHRKAKAIINELNKRTGVMDNIGGTTKEKRVTAYRESALHVAYALSLEESSKPSEIKKKTGLMNANAILYSNYYKWYERIDRGQYRLTSEGYQALETYHTIIDYFKSKENV